jgi:hypothetical protein
METFIEARPFVSDPGFERARKASRRALRELIIKGEIDRPLVPIVQDFALVPHCYTLQSCFGHFVHEFEPDTRNIASLEPYSGKVAEVEYRIAYMAFCIRESELGHHLCHDLRAITRIDPSCIQFGCAEWFWESQVNTYVIQVEPERFRNKDSIRVKFDEALQLEAVRDRFMEELQRVAALHRDMPGA